MPAPTPPPVLTPTPAPAAVPTAPCSADAREFQLCSGLPAFLVHVPAMAVHSDKFQKQAQKEKGRLEELAKQQAQHAQQGGSVELAAAAAVSGAASGSSGTAAAPGAAAEKKEA